MPTVNVLRYAPNDPTGAPPVVVATGVYVEIQPAEDLSEDGPVVPPTLLALEPVDVWDIYALVAPLPDIRMGDQLVDPGDIDPNTQQPRVYTVQARPRPYAGSHLEIKAQTRAAPPTT